MRRPESLVQPLGRGSIIKAIMALEIRTWSARWMLLSALAALVSNSMLYPSATPELYNLLYVIQALILYYLCDRPWSRPPTKSTEGWHDDRHVHR